MKKLFKFILIGLIICLLIGLTVFLILPRTIKSNSNGSNNGSEIPKFTKIESDILKDLRDSNIGIPVVGREFTGDFCYGSAPSTYLFGGTTMDRVNEFKVIDSKRTSQYEAEEGPERTKGIVCWQEVTIKTDVDFTGEDSTLNKLNHYNAKGTFVVIYHKAANKDDWDPPFVKDLSGNFTVTNKDDQSGSKEQTSSSTATTVDDILKQMNEGVQK